MSLGLRKHIVAFLEKRLHRLFPLLLLLALCYPLAVPIAFSRRNFFDENALLPAHAETVVGTPADVEETVRRYSRLRPEGAIVAASQTCSRCTLRHLPKHNATMLFLHAPRSAGREAMVLHTFWDTAEGGSLPVGLHLVDRYSRQAWLHYDLVLVVTPPGPAHATSVIDDIESNGVRIRAAVVLDIGARVPIPIVIDTILHP